MVELKIDPDFARAIPKMMDDESDDLHIVRLELGEDKIEEIIDDANERMEKEAQQRIAEAQQRFADQHNNWDMTM